MSYSQAEMDLMRYGTDGHEDFRYSSETDYYAVAPKKIVWCDGCGLVNDECECEEGDYV